MGIKCTVVVFTRFFEFLDLMLARQGTLKVALWCEEIRLFRGTPKESLR
jgi:hypothetical protein